MQQGKKLLFTQNCMTASLYNNHTEVFEFFCCHGYIPSLNDINLVSKMDRRFILVSRFYPNLTEPKNNFQNIQKNIVMSDTMKHQEKIAEIKESERQAQSEKIKNSVIFTNKWANEKQEYILCNMYDPVKVPKYLINTNIFSDDSDTEDDHEVPIKKHK